MFQPGIMSGRIIPSTGEKGRDFQELGHHPVFDLFMVGLKTVLVGAGEACHLAANISQQVFTDVQGPLKVLSSTILDLAGSSQFMSCALAMPFF